MNGSRTEDGPASVELAPGLVHCPGYLDRSAQEELLGAVRDLVRAAPLFTPRMPRTGKPFSVRMTNCGPLGWVSDVGGYRYQATHPETGLPWPAMPELLVRAWAHLSGYPELPEAGLVNWYEPGARMGLHQDRDEEAFDAPVVSLSLGASALFRFGGGTRRGPTRSVELRSGDAMVLGGPARLIYHGVDRILAGGGGLVEGGARINLTLRRVTRP